MPQTDTATLHLPPSTSEETALVPQLFCVLEAGCPSYPASRHALVDVDEISLGRASSGNDERYERDGATRQLTIRIWDRWLSSKHAVIAREGDDHVFRDLGSKNGSRINGTLVEAATLRDGDVIELGQTFLMYRKRSPLPSTQPLDFMIAAEQVPRGLGTLLADLNDRFSDLGRIAASDTRVAILGQTGTGKELIAEAIHQMSRREGKLIAVNCGAIPRELISSELFGHTRGAFTGATADHPGMIRAADGGTLFLDEIGDLPLEQQVVLLRVLQDCKVTPIGGSPRKVDFRLVVATNRDMETMLSAGLFRDDLWARVSGYKLNLLPLRERREDLGLILGAMLAHHRPAGAPRVTIFSDAVWALLRHEWPQNIRELEQCLKSALALCQGDTIALANLPEAIRTARASRPLRESVTDEDPAEALDELRREHLCKLLERTGGNLSEVARLMGKHRPQIQRWIKRYGIDPRRYRPPAAPRSTRSDP